MIEPIAMNQKFFPTKEQRSLVSELAADDLSQNVIANWLGINQLTLARNFKSEIEEGRDLRFTRVVESMMGKRFGELTVVGYDRYLNQCRYWKCKCSCGRLKSYPTGKLNAGHARTCGCGNGIAQLAGRRFGSLVVRELHPFRKDRSAVWHCICDCGTSRLCKACELISGGCNSCGCMRSENHTKYKVADTGRTCGSCGNYKPMKEFGSRKSAPNGRRSNCRACACLSSKKASDSISDAYVAGQLGLPLARVPRALLDLKREHIRLVRELKERNR